MILPKHVAIVPDGNRRWARAQGLPTLVGHKKGFERAVAIVNASREMGIHTLTLWAFSAENWNRTKREVGYLMKLYHDMIDAQLKEAHKYQSRMVHLGRKDRIPEGLAKKIAKAEEETRNYTKHILNIALDYGGQDEILRAIAKLMKNGELTRLPDGQGMENFPNYLDTGGQPYPEVDLMIRPGGEQRTSGLLLWQSAYTEYYFTDDFFPDFTVEKFKKAIMEFGRRQRRFGGN